MRANFHTSLSHYGATWHCLGEDDGITGAVAATKGKLLVVIRLYSVLRLVRLLVVIRLLRLVRPDSVDPHWPVELLPELFGDANRIDVPDHRHRSLHAVHRHLIDPWDHGPPVNYIEKQSLSLSPLVLSYNDFTVIGLRGISGAKKKKTDLEAWL